MEREREREREILLLLDPLRRVAVLLQEVEGQPVA